MLLLCNVENKYITNENVPFLKRRISGEVLLHKEFWRCHLYCRQSLRLGVRQAGVSKHCRPKIPVLGFFFFFFLLDIFITFILYWHSLNWTLYSFTREDKAWGDMCLRTGYSVFLVSYRHTIAQALEKRNRNIYIWYKWCCGSTNRWQLGDRCQQPRWHSALFRPFSCYYGRS